MARKLTHSSTIPRSLKYRTRNNMETANAFIDHAAQPTPEELTAALGPTATIWNKLVGCLADEYGLNVQEWNSYSLKAGWSMRLKLKKRNILYMAPCRGCFRVAFVLGDKSQRGVRPRRQGRQGGPPDQAPATHPQSNRRRSPLPRRNRSTPRRKANVGPGSDPKARRNQTGELIAALRRPR